MALSSQETAKAPRYPAERPSETCSAFYEAGGRDDYMRKFAARDLEKLAEYRKQYASVKRRKAEAQAKAISLIKQKRPQALQWDIDRAFSDFGYYWSEWSDYRRYIRDLRCSMRKNRGEMVPLP